jgi:hypothetical protein
MAVCGRRFLPAADLAKIGENPEIAGRVGAAGGFLHFRRFSIRRGR